MYIKTMQTNSVFHNKDGISHSVCTFNNVKNIDIYDYKRIHVVASAVRFQRGFAHTCF